MKKFIKAFSAFLVAVIAITLLASCKKPKTSTKPGGNDFCYLTIELDTKADTSTLKNTVKVMNKTTNQEIRNGDGFTANDELSVTLFNCASDVKMQIIRLTDPTYDILPSFGYDQLTGSDVTVGQEPIEFEAPASIKIIIKVDDGEETIEYGKFYISNTASDAKTRITKLDGDFDVKEIGNDTTIIVNETIYGEVENKSTTESIIVAIYIDNQLDETYKLNPGERTTDIYFAAGEVNNIYVEPYTTCTISTDSTSLTIKTAEDVTITSGSPVGKYTIYKVTINNESESKKVFKITSGTDVILTMIIGGYDTVNTDEEMQLVLTKNVVLTFEEINGPTITINAPKISDGALVSVYYIYGDGETDTESVESGDKIPSGYRFEITVYILDEEKAFTATISIGGVVVKTEEATFNENGYTISGDNLVATSDIIVTVE